MRGLTAIKVKTAKPGRYSDGRGLYLLVKDSGTRSWILRVQANGQRRDLGLGSASNVSLAEARTAADQARALAKEGRDPANERRKARTKTPTFEKAARDCYAALRPGWKNAKHVDSWIASLESYVFPKIGAKPVDVIDSIAVRNLLEPIWLRVPETARRVLQRIGVVLDFAHINGWRPTEAALRSVRKGLPRQPKRDGHFEAMPYEDVPAFVTALREAVPTVGRDALCFTIFTAVRSNETRFAAWSEFDLKKSVWSIPGERMKMAEPHIVPLPASAIELLQRRWKARSTDDGLVFSADGAKPISDMTMTKVLRDEGIPSHTVHGFRSAFTDWAAEMTDTPKEVVDKALAHKIPDRVEAAYRRTDFFEKRRKLMKAWADYVDGESVARDSEV